MKKVRGLTLVELMVVVAVMAVLGTIVYPMYTEQARKARRSDAKIALESLALAQERYFTVNGEYAASTGSLDISTALQGGTSEKGYYTLALTRSGLDNSSYSATMTKSASGAQSGDSDCISFTLTHQGVKSSTGSGSNCW